MHSLSTGGAHSRVEASITTPTSPPYVAKQLTAQYRTQPLCQCRQEAGKIYSFTDSEGMKTPKPGCSLKFQDKEVYQFGFQVCRRSVPP